MRSAPHASGGAPGLRRASRSHAHTHVHTHVYSCPCPHACPHATGGDGILKRDNSDRDVASELQPRCRAWIFGARAGLGLRNGGWKGLEGAGRGHIERFGGKMTCLLKYVIVGNWALLSPRMPEHATCHARYVPATRTTQRRPPCQRAKCRNVFVLTKVDGFVPAHADIYTVR